MRGTLLIAHLWFLRSGIIPAYAGNTDFISDIVASLWDHPRVCGEHRSSSPNASKRSGSSPRMRGTPSTATFKEADWGIIPAYAGNTGPTCICSPEAGDHPRVCGEHCTCVAVVPAITGSSPRMRGTRITAALIYQGDGIIPAYAGNTPCTDTWPWPRRDHPRVCGEHTKRL